MRWCKCSLSTLSNKVATSQLWLLDTYNVASVSEELNFLILFDLNNHEWLVSPSSPHSAGGNPSDPAVCTPYRSFFVRSQRISRTYLQKCTSEGFTHMTSGELSRVALSALLYSSQLLPSVRCIWMLPGLFGHFPIEVHLELFKQNHNSFISASLYIWAWVPVLRMGFLSQGGKVLIFPLWTS